MERCPGGCSSLLLISSVSEHIVNFFFMLLDFLLASHVFQQKFLWAPLSFGAWYSAWPPVAAEAERATDDGRAAIFEWCWALSRYATYGDDPPYSFLASSSPYEPLWIIGLIAIILVAFHAVWLLSKYGLHRKMPDADAGDAVAGPAAGGADTNKSGEPKA